MASKCPKCDRTVQEDLIYCPYCGHGLKPSAMTPNVSVAGVLMIVAAADSLVLFVLSIRALLQIYTWYPQLVAQSWFIYDQLLAVFSLLAMVSGLSASALSLTRNHYRWAMLSATLCLLSGAVSWIVSMIIPEHKLLDSILYYFLPAFFAPLLAAILIYPRKPEFKQ